MSSSMVIAVAAAAGNTVVPDIALLVTSRRNILLTANPTAQTIDAGSSTFTIEWMAMPPANAPAAASGEEASVEPLTVNHHDMKLEAVFVVAPSIKESLRTAALVF